MVVNVCLHGWCDHVQGGGSTVRVVTSSIHFATLCALWGQRGQVSSEVCMWYIHTHLARSCMQGESTQKYLQAISHPKPPLGDRDDSSPSSICWYLLVYCWICGFSSNTLIVFSSQHQRQRQRTYVHWAVERRCEHTGYAVSICNRKRPQTWLSVHMQGDLRHVKRRPVLRFWTMYIYYWFTYSNFGQSDFSVKSGRVKFDNQIILWIIILIYF